MVASVLIYEDGRRALDEWLRPDSLPCGAEPEQRVIYCDISWSRYLSLDDKLGHDRPSPRLDYLDGELEIMTTSNVHERIKKWLGGFLELWSVAWQSDHGSRLDKPFGPD